MYKNSRMYKNWISRLKVHRLDGGALHKHPFPPRPLPSPWKTPCQRSDQKKVLPHISPWNSSSRNPFQTLPWPGLRCSVKSASCLKLWLKNTRRALMSLIPGITIKTRPSKLCETHIFTPENIHLWKIFTPEKYSPMKNIHIWEIFTIDKYSLLKNIHPLENIHPSRIFASKKFSFLKNSHPFKIVTP